MNRLTIVRIAAVAAGAGALFGLQHGLDFSLYIALPLATLVYLAIKVGLGLLWGGEPT